METISSRANPLIVRVAKLSDRKYREKERLFFIEGVKLFEEMQKAAILPVYAFATEKTRYLLDTLPDTVEKFCVNESVYEKISNEKSPQGIFCVIKYLDNFHKSDTIYSGIFRSSVFCVSSLQDPGNLGTIVRAARAFGVGTLLLSDDCADLYSPKTLRASMGALFAVPTLRTPDLAASLLALQKMGYDTYAAALDNQAMPPRVLPLCEKTCFVVGNEGHGLSQEILKACGKTVYIPMTGGCESLNVSIAASILMWEQFQTITTKKEV